MIRTVLRPGLLAPLACAPLVELIAVPPTFSPSHLPGGVGGVVVLKRPSPPANVWYVGVHCRGGDEAPCPRWCQRGLGDAEHTGGGRQQCLKGHHLY